MYFILYLTERCNLTCTYCEPRLSRQKQAYDIRYPLDQLIDFLAADPNLCLQFYGGEPLLRIDLIESILARVQTRRVCIQTNALLLDQIPTSLFERIDAFSISLDGPRAITDACRGDGIYDRAIAQVSALRQRGYRGHIGARMTTSPGVPIYDAVAHFIDGCEFAFDSVYWQLNVLFGSETWRFDKRFVQRWFKRQYNPQITALIDRWLEELRDRQRLVEIIPFVTTSFNILTGRRVEQIQCGAGVFTWTVTPSGDIYACPVLRGVPNYHAGHIAELRPQDIQPLPGLRRICAECSVLELCGGRCIYASESMLWGMEGFALVCASVKHMIRELRRVAPDFQRYLTAAGIDLSGLAGVGFDYEVIP